MTREPHSKKMDGRGRQMGEYHWEPAGHHPNLKWHGRVRTGAEQMEGCSEGQPLGLKD